MTNLHAEPEASDAAAGSERCESLEWSFNPWRERPGIAALAAMFALGMCMLVIQFGLPFIVTLALCLLAVSSLAPVMSPARCRIDDEGVARRGPVGWTRRAWHDIRRAVAGRRGVMVSPFSSPHWLDPYRSLFLPFPSLERDTLIQESSRRLALHGF